MSVSVEDKNRFQFILGFIFTMVVLVYIVSWTGPWWKLCLILLVATIVFSLFVIWIGKRMLTEPEIQREFDFNGPISENLDE